MKTKEQQKAYEIILMKNAIYTILFSVYLCMFEIVIDLIFNVTIY